MAIINFSGSIESESGGGPVLPAYRVCVFGTIEVGDTSRNPVVCLYNTGTGSLLLKSVNINISPKGEATHQNDVIWALGAVASGSISGTSINPTPLSRANPASNALAYSSPSGLSIGPAMNGALVRAQSASITGDDSPLTIIPTDIDLFGGELLLAPNDAYLISLTANVIPPGGATLFVYTAEFAWDESD